jgi:glycosyltransferase involved in cell wall biosynthesis
MYRLLMMSHSPFYPDAIGGSELSIHYLLSSLVRRGWGVEVVCQRSGGTPQVLDAPEDRSLGYPCFRVHADGLFEQIDARIQQFRPHASLAGVYSFSLHLLRHALARGVPGFYYATIDDNMRRKFGPTFRLPPGIHPLANSEVTAACLRAIQASDFPIVSSMIDLERYTVEGPREKSYVTFINPVPVKGVAVALKVAARMPERRFLFVRSRWGDFTAPDASATDASLAAAAALPNVTIWEPQVDMRRVYAQTDILFFPSQWQESTGRAILEAHVNRIPVVASRVGGVERQLGKGGILVSPADDVEAYIQAITALGDEGTYAEYARLAYENSGRPELQPEVQVQIFIDYVRRRLSGARPEAERAG